MSTLEHRGMDHSQYAQVFKALSDETRQKILVLLKDQPLSVGQIVQHFPLAQPTISRHLAVLRQAGLVRAERSRQQMIYRLVTATMQRCCDGFMKGFCRQDAPQP